MGRLLYIISHSTDDPDRASTALAAAAAAAEHGHETGVWLTGEGVRLAVKSLADALSERGGRRTAAESLDVLAARGATLYGSRPCFEARQFTEEVLREGTRLADPHELADLAAKGWIPIAT